VLDALHEMKIEDRVELRDTRASQENLGTLTRITGKEQVPCLMIDGRPMHESDEIILYLEESFDR